MPFGKAEKLCSPPVDEWFAKLWRCSRYEDWARLKTESPAIGRVSKLSLTEECFTIFFCRWRYPSEGKTMMDDSAGRRCESCSMVPCPCPALALMWDDDQAKKSASSRASSSSMKGKMGRNG